MTQRESRKDRKEERERECKYIKNVRCVWCEWMSGWAIQFLVFAALFGVPFQNYDRRPWRRLSVWPIHIFNIHIKYTIFQIANAISFSHHIILRTFFQFVFSNNFLFFVLFSFGSNAHKRSSSFFTYNWNHTNGNLLTIKKWILLRFKQKFFRMPLQI